MEASTESGTNVQLTEVARLEIRKLVRLDGFQRQQKAVLFEQSYKLWTTDGLISERSAKDNLKKIARSYLKRFLIPLKGKKIYDYYRINTQFSWGGQISSYRLIFLKCFLFQFLIFIIILFNILYNYFSIPGNPIFGTKFYQQSRKKISKINNITFPDVFLYQ